MPLRAARRLPRRRRVLSGLRRPVAAVLLAAAAALAVDAVAADPPPGAPLTVAARDLPAGHRLAAGDLATVRVPPDAVPDGAAGPRAAGRVLSTPVRRGEPLTDVRLRGGPLLTAAEPGTLAVPVRVAEPAALVLVEPGSRVTVLAGPDLDGLDGRGEVLVPAAVVLRVLAGPEAGLLGAGSAEGTVVLALDRAEATRVAAAVGRRPLLVALLA